MKKYNFEDIVLKNGGFLRGPFGGDLKKEIFVPKEDDTYKVYEQGVVLQRDSNVGRYYISKEYFEKNMSRFEVKRNDFLVSCSGVNYGAIYQLKGIIEKGIINQALLRIRLNNDLVDDNYFLYLFRLYIVNMIIGKKGDSTIPNFPPLSVIKKLRFGLPELSIQKKIVKILYSLDTKIELNNRINAELEQMAKTLYDYWFVQFDFPANLADSTLSGAEGYKSSGGKMVYNKELKREIPEGWEVGTLLDIATFTNGLACQNYRPFNDNFLPVIKIREMRDGFTESTEKVRADIPEKLIVENGDILFSWSASLEVIIWSGGKGGLNQHIFKVTSEKYPKSFIYFQLLRYLRHFKMIAELRKTTMGHITQDHLKQSRIIIPSLSIIKELDLIINPIQSKQVKLKEENQQLSTLRDWLLPMLMNGQVRVREAHGKTVKEAEEKLSMVVEPSRNMAAEPEGEYGKN